MSDKGKLIKINELADHFYGPGKHTLPDRRRLLILLKNTEQQTGQKLLLKISRYYYTSKQAINNAFPGFLEPTTDVIELLKEQNQNLQEQIDQLKRRIAKLEK